MNVLNFNCIYFYNHPIGKIIEKQHLIAVYETKKKSRTKQENFQIEELPSQYIVILLKVFNFVRQFFFQTK